MILRTLALILGLALGGQGWAEASLYGRTVTFRVLSYDDPDRPIFEGRGVTVKVGDGVEFGLNPEGAQNGVDVVPMIVDILPNRIEVRSTIGPGYFLDAAFNGYVLEFATDCALFDEVLIDRKATTLPLKPTDVTVQGGQLRVNVAGMAYTDQTTVALNLRVADCPLS